MTTSIRHTHRLLPHRISVGLHTSSGIIDTIVYELRTTTRRMTKYKSSLLKNTHLPSSCMHARRHARTRTHALTCTHTPKQSVIINLPPLVQHSREWAIGAVHFSYQSLIFLWFSEILTFVKALFIFLSSPLHPSNLLFHRDLPSVSPGSHTQSTITWRWAWRCVRSLRIRGKSIL